MIRLLSIFALFLLSAFSCSNDDDTAIPADEPTRIVDVQGPTQGTVGEPVSFEVTFMIKNGCGKFERLDQQQSGYTRTITVHAKYVGEICTEALVYLTTTYTFTPSKAGTYTLRFWQAPNTYLTKTIDIN